MVWTILKGWAIALNQIVVSRNKLKEVILTEGDSVLLYRQPKEDEKFVENNCYFFAKFQKSRSGNDHTPNGSGS